MSRALPLTGVPGKMARRLAAVTLLGLGMSLFLGGLVARQVAVAAKDTQGRATTYLIGGIVLAVLCLLVSALLRTRYGVPLGWAVLLLTLLSALVLPAMVLIAGVFGVLWVLSLTQGQRIDELMAVREPTPEEQGP